MWVKESRHGPADGARRFLPCPGEGGSTHARGLRADLRRPRAGLRRLRRADRGRAAHGPALPPATGVPAVRRRATGLGRRPALQRHLPRAPHGAAGAGGRGPAATARGARVLAAARPREAAVGDLARRRARRRPLRADLQDPPRARGRDLGRGHPHRALRPRARPAGARRPGRPGRRGRCRAAAELLDAVAGRPRRRRRSASRVRCSRGPTRPAPTRAAPSPGWPRWPRRGSRARRPRR